MKKGRSHFSVDHNHLASLSLAAILLFVTFLNVPGLHAAHASTVTLPGGSLTTTNLDSWTVNTLVYDTYFDFSAGPTTISIYDLDLTDIWYEGVWPWPPVASSLGAQARFGVSADGFWSQHMIASAIGNGGGSWDQQSMKWTHDEGFRKYLIQNQFSGTSSDVTKGNHQYNVEAYIPRGGAGPSINNPAQVADRGYNTFDMKITYTSTGTPGTYQVQGWVRLHKAASATEMQTRPGSPPWTSPYTWVWNKAINNQANPDSAWVPFYDGSWIVTGFQNPVRPYVQIMNWGVPQTKYHTFSWGSLVIEGTLYQIPATVNIDPDTLNLKSKGKWITAYVTLPSGWTVGDIDLDTVYLDEVRASWGETQGDVLMIKFDRQAFGALSTGSVQLTITGELTNGQPFTATDTITVISK